MFQFNFSEPNDLETINYIYLSAAQYQAQKGYNVWPLIAPEVLLEEITLQRHIKILCENQIAGVFTLAFEDPIIWDEKGKDESAVYLHRIATHPYFKGKNLVGYMVEWAKGFATKNNKSVLRIDTWADNSNLINFYVHHGFKIVGEKYLPVSSLPKHYWNITVTLFEQLAMGN